MEEKRTLKIAIAVVIFVVFFAGTYWGVSYFFNNSYQNPQNPNNQNPGAKTAAPANTPVAPGSKTAPANQGTTLSYSAAIKTYGTRRIQFSVNSAGYCTMNPSNPGFKNGTKIMLDNRYSKQLKITVGGVVYYVPAYNFKIITLYTVAAIPHTIKVSCGSGVNNGSIVLN
jgi:hypothetical protein